MTREDAINKWIIPAIKNTWNEKKCSEIIKALSTEPCEDAISRQTTINYLCKNMCWYDSDGNMADDDEQEKAITDLINGIPPVQPIRPKGKRK